MEYLSVVGNRVLGGEAAVHGAKNSVLPILAAASMINGEAVIHNCPKLSDVENTVKILRYLGAEVEWQGSTVTVNSKAINKNDIPKSLMSEMRSSIIFLGALSSRMGSACLYLPGGCEIGLRPIDMHLKGLADLSGVVSFDGSNVCCDMKNAKADKVVLPFPSVGATENLILSAVFLKGKTTIINAAREPEIVDLCSFLNKAGAKISGGGSTIIDIEGCDKLNSVEHTVIPDRILASTLMSACAITGGKVRIKNISLPALEGVFPIYLESGCELNLEHNALTITAPKRLRRVKKIVTRPYPGFPTDCQAPVSAMLSVAKGTTIISETIFENRFKHMRELIRFGADININGQLAVINGVSSLLATEAKCTDLRGGAAVVIAALKADGNSIIKDIYHLDRGYESIESLLSLTGADIKRISDEKEADTKEDGEKTES